MYIQVRKHYKIIHKCYFAKKKIFLFFFALNLNVYCGIFSERHQLVAFRKVSQFIYQKPLTSPKRC